VVTQNFSPRSARALFQKNPPSLIPGSASDIYILNGASLVPRLLDPQIFVAYRGEAWE